MDCWLLPARERLDMTEKGSYDRKGLGRATGMAGKADALLPLAHSKIALLLPFDYPLATDTV
eukprot:scaffold177621_cov22-Tisochrysis_lutea.AAC.2